MAIIQISCNSIRKAASFAVVLFDWYGEYPTEARVSKLISKPQYFQRCKQILTALREARLELSLSS